MSAPVSVIDAGPFELTGSRDAAVLCLHGLTGTPYEVRPLGEACAALGLTAFGPALPGHHETPESLAAIGSYAAWADAARGHVRRLRLRHSRVFAAGLSMGGLLALLLAEEGLVDGIVVIGTPLQLPLPVRVLVPLLWRVRPFQPKTGGSDIRDAAARARHPSYPTMPLRSVKELMRLQRVVRASLGRVTEPILVAHGAFDRTARPLDARVILDRVSSAKKELLSCDASAHVVTVDIDGPLLARKTAQFLSDLVADAGSTWARVAGAPP
jgi:carboxylesterase